MHLNRNKTKPKQHVMNEICVIYIIDQIELTD